MRNCVLPACADDLAQDLSQFFRRENERRWIRRVVLRERDIIDLRPDFALEAVEIFQAEKPAKAAARGRREN